MPLVLQSFSENWNDMTLLRGPVFTVYVPFTDTDELDLTSLRRYVDFLLHSGARQLYLMPYNGRYGQLRAYEWAILARELADRVAYVPGVTLIIGERLDGPTYARIEEFNQLDLPSSVVLSTLPNERFFSVDQYAQHFSAYSNIDRPVLAHLMPVISGYTGITADLTLDVYSTLAEMKHIVAIKEDHKSIEHLLEVSRILPERISLAIAGRKRLLLEFAQLAGTDFAYLNGLSLVDPSIAFTFWRLLEEDMDTCDQFVASIDDPFWDHVVNKYGWHRCNRALLEVAGFGHRRERLPMVELNEDEFNDVRDFCRLTQLEILQWI